MLAVHVSSCRFLALPKTLQAVLQVFATSLAQYSMASTCALVLETNLIPIFPQAVVETVNLFLSVFFFDGGNVQSSLNSADNYLLVSWIVFVC